MVEVNETQQMFYDLGGHGPITTADVCDVVDRDVSDAQIAERFEGVDLLPDYVAEAGRRLFLWHGSDRISEKEYVEAVHRLTSGPSREEDRALTLSTLRMLARQAFELCAMLKDEDGYDCDMETLGRFHTERRPAASGDPVRVDYVATYRIPGCSYLQFLWNGCERLSAPPLNADGYVLPADEDDGYDFICGWVGCKAGGVLEVAGRDAKDTEEGRHDFLCMLAKFLLDVHLYDCQLVTYGIGRRSAVTKNAVSALWMRLCGNVGNEHAGSCRVCGKPFVATNERRWKTRYCQVNGACAKAYARTRRVLGVMAEGVPLDEAVGQVRNIGTRRVVEIVRRNRHTLREEFPTVDLDAIARRDER